MNQSLKCYQVVMRTIGPVFVGTGKDFGKKEYVFLNGQQVGIPDIQSLYHYLEKCKKAEAFERYLLGNGREDLTAWLERQRISTEKIKPFIRYTLDCRDALVEDGRRLQIMECIKDAYGQPYIPGSSLKGMIRTLFLGADMTENPQKYQDAKSTMRENMDNKVKRNYYLQSEIRKIEEIRFRTLKREKTKPGDAVNDVLQGLAVSDSEPLSTSCLVLCQKVDKHTRGDEKRLPILRECIQPGTEIKYTITVDTSVCDWTEETFFQAIQKFMDNYRNNFMNAFPSAELPDTSDCVLLGGGCGFPSKTVVYPLFGKKEGIRTVQKIYEKTNVPREHKHYLDEKYGASPHILKCTKYKGKTVQMGLCKVESITEIR